MTVGSRANGRFRTGTDWGGIFPKQGTRYWFSWGYRSHHTVSDWLVAFGQMYVMLHWADVCDAP